MKLLFPILLEPIFIFVQLGFSIELDNTTFKALIAPIT